MFAVLPLPRESRSFEAPRMMWNLVIFSRHAQMRLLAIFQKILRLEAARRPWNVSRSPAALVQEMQSIFPRYRIQTPYEGLLYWKCVALTVPFLLCFARFHSSPPSLVLLTAPCLTLIFCKLSGIQCGGYFPGRRPCDTTCGLFSSLPCFGSR